MINKRQDVAFRKHSRRINQEIRFAAAFAGVFENLRELRAPETPAIASEVEKSDRSLSCLARRGREVLQTIRYLDLAFDREMLLATRSDGAKIRFTRQERALLLQLARQPGKLLTRERLVEFLSRDGADASERNIDFLVNRLRKRLGDSARKPRFIATRYGEGYVWIAAPDEGEHSDAFLMIGPAYGLGTAGPLAEVVLKALAEALAGKLGPGRPLACVPDWQPQPVGANGPSFSLEVSFHAASGILHAALVLRDGRTRSSIGAFRARFDAEGARATASEAAARVEAAIWAHLAMPHGALVVAPVDMPLDIRMHEAAQMLCGAPVSWRETERHLLEARAANPNDPVLAVMWGLNLYTRLLQQVAEPEGPMSEAEWAAVEDEIEAVALESLPKIGSHPLLVLAVAKLLFFIDRGHAALAARLANEAFENSTAFGAAFVLQGQLLMSEGHIEDALRLFDEGLEMAEEGSEFQVFLMAVKMIALLAAGDRASLDRLTAVLFALKPGARAQFGLILASPKAAELPPDLEAALGALDEVRARNLIHYFFNVCARRCGSPAHRRNIMKGLLSHMVRRFGRAIVPPSVERALDLRPEKPGARSVG